MTYVIGNNCPSSSGYKFGERNVIDKNKINPKEFLVRLPLHYYMIIQAALCS